MAGDVVIKLAQPGYDVKTAGDENLVYSSQWPLLKIYRQDKFRIPDVTVATTIATHDLKFIPVFWWFSNATLAAWSNGFGDTLVNEQRSEFFGPTGGGTLSIDANKLNFSPEVNTNVGALNGYYYIFALDLTKQYTAPVVRIGAVSGRGEDKYVFKIAKPGKDVSSHNLDDFIVHSRARSPLIHSVNPGKVTEDLGGGNFGFTVYHDLDYLPMFFGYTKNANGSYSIIYTGQGGSTLFESDEKKIRFTEAANTREMTIVILKDPFLIDYTRQVVV
jgi:hypothetical protein